MKASAIVALSKTTPRQKDTVESTRTRRLNQKAQKRRETLLKKAFEYYTECDADINLVVRMRKTGQIFTLTSHSQGWPLSEEQLVSRVLFSLF
jgi:hypothetical protein